jgi:hypothetical protein
MRVMTLMLAGMLAVLLAGGQALAAKRTSSSGVVNPDRQYYKGAETCGGNAACYRAPKKKTK